MVAGPAYIAAVEGKMPNFLDGMLRRGVSRSRLAQFQCTNLNQQLIARGLDWRLRAEALVKKLDDEEDGKRKL